MIKKRKHLVLFGVLACFLVTAIAVVAYRLVQPEGTRDRFDQLRLGMTREEVVAIMGRRPDSWGGESYGAKGDEQAPWSKALVIQWVYPNGHNHVVVFFDQAGRAKERRWRDDTEPLPFWYPLQRWLRR